MRNELNASLENEKNTNAVNLSAQTASSIPIRIKPQSTDAINLLSSISDAQLHSESKDMIERLQNNWYDYWDIKDNKLDLLPRTSPEQINTIRKKREQLWDKTWSDNKDLLSQAVALKDECLKRGSIQDANDLKEIISKFSDPQERRRIHH